METTDTLRRRIISTLHAMHGKPVWDVMGGPVHGPTIEIQLGERRERRVPLSNPRLTDDQRRHEGELVLFITCAWRLEIAGSIVCGSESRNEEDGEIAGGLDLLIGRSVSRVVVDEQTLDCTVMLEPENARLSIFCDEIDPESDRDNYHITLADELLIVGARSIARREERRFSYRAPLRPV